MKSVKLLLIILSLLTVFDPTDSNAAPYYNSSETGCDGTDSTVVFCDDFEDGDWFQTRDDPGNASNDGWSLIPDFSGGATPPQPPPPATRTGGVGGTGYYAYSIANSGFDGGNTNRGLHALAPSQSTYSELYFRMYMRLEPRVGSGNSTYQQGGGMKVFSLIRDAYSAGIHFGGGPTLETRFPYAAPSWDLCRGEPPTNYRNPLNPGGWVYLQQNTGNNITLVDGTWYAMQWHVQMNTYNVANGKWRLWIDDCGTTGTSCSGSPTLRADYDNVGWQGSTDCASPTLSGNIGSFWLDYWGDDDGELRLDNIKVATVGPIAFVGGDTTPPDAPTNLTISAP